MYGVVGCILVLVASSVAYFTPISDTIGYQIHSMNDLREWRSLLKKGVEFAKIDMHYNSHDFCKQLPSRYPAKVRNDSRGCYLLVHDTPNAKNEHYYTPDDFLDLLIKPLNARYFQTNQTFRVSLCFKNVKKCDVTTWPSLMDDFFAEAQSLKGSHPRLNVDFILDDLPVNCMLGKWRPWVSTWIRNPVAAFFSNDKEHGYDCYQVMNVPIPPKVDYTITINLLKALKYGKFLHSNYSYPFLAWEPSNQDIILQVTDAYLSGGQALINPNGFRFAINIDPKQFDVYAGSRSAKAWNFAFEGQYYRPKITSFDTGKMIMLYTLCETCNNYEYQILSTDRVLGKLSASGEKFIVNPPIKLVSQLSSTKVGKDVYLWMSHENAYAFSAIVEEEIVVIDHGELPISINSTSTLFSRNGEHYVAAIDHSAACGAQFSLWSIKPKERPPIVYTSCVMQVSKFVDPVIAVEQVGNTTFGVLYYTADNHVFGCTFTLNASRVISSWTCSTKPIGVGTTPTASIKYNGQNLTVLQVHNDGFCYNNEPQNKAALPSVCDQQPISRSRVLEYSYGEWIDFEKHFKSEMGYITSCHDDILHGMYDMGINPSVALYTDKFNLGMIAVHEALQSGFHDNSNCGVPRYHKAGTLIVDSWSLTVF